MSGTVSRERAWPHRMIPRSCEPPPADPRLLLSEPSVCASFNLQHPLHLSPFNQPKPDEQPDALQSVSKCFYDGPLAYHDLMASTRPPDTRVTPFFPTP